VKFSAYVGLQKKAKAALAYEYWAILTSEISYGDCIPLYDIPDALYNETLHYRIAVIYHDA